MLETWGQELESEEMLPPGLLPLVNSATFSYSSMGHLPRDGTARSGLGLSPSITNQHTAPQTTIFLTGQSDRCDEPTTELPPFQVSLVCIKLEKIKENNI